MPQIDCNEKKKAEPCLAAKKNLIRSMLIEQRKSLASELVTEWSLTAQQNLLSAPCWKDADAVMLYMPSRNEVETYLLAASARKQNKHVLFPRCSSIPGEMDFVECPSADDFCRGRFGLSEPRSELPTFAFDSVNNVLCVLPAIAYDHSCNRLGYGGGYYDRWLSRHRERVVCVGLAYYFQVIENIPSESWDIPVSAIYTERSSICISPSFRSGFQI